MLGIVSVFLKCAKHTIQVITDHQPLTYFNTKRQLTRCQACWSDKLANFHFKISYRSGKQSTKPDAFSCQLDHEISNVHHAHNNIQLVSLLHTEISSTLLDEVVDHQSRDDFCKKILQGDNQVQDPYKIIEVKKHRQILYKDHLFTPASLHLLILQHQSTQSWPAIQAGNALNS